MKALITIVRVLLGLMFVVFGLNGFFQFMKAPPPPGAAGDFVKALFSSHYYYAIAALQVIGGLLCLVGSRFVPLGLLILGPIIVNIVLYHIFLLPTGYGGAIIVSVLSLFLLWAYRHAFAGIFTPKKFEAPTAPDATVRKGEP